MWWDNYESWNTVEAFPWPQGHLQQDHTFLLQLHGAFLRAEWPACLVQDGGKSGSWTDLPSEAALRTGLHPLHSSCLLGFSLPTDREGENDESQWQWRTESEPICNSLESQNMQKEPDRGCKAEASLSFSFSPFFKSNTSRGFWVAPLCSSAPCAESLSAACSSWVGQELKMWLFIPWVATLAACEVLRIVSAQFFQMLFFCQETF